MTTTEKLKLVLGITNNVIREMSVNDTRIEAMYGIRDGLIDAILDMEKYE